MRIIRGTRDLKGRIIQKQPEGGIDRMRCMCGGIAVSRRDPTTGTQVHYCAKCGRSFTKRAM